MEQGRQQARAHRYGERIEPPEERMNYEQRLLRAYDRLERPLFKIMLLGFALVILAQVALAIPAGRKLLSSTDQLEGVRTNSALPTTAISKDHVAQLTISLVGTTASLPNVWVKVDGVPVGSFGQPQVNVAVHDGDQITVDSSAVQGVLRYQIDCNDPVVSYPVPGTLVESNDNIPAQIGPVEFMK